MITDQRKKEIREEFVKLLHEVEESSGFNTILAVDEVYNFLYKLEENEKP